MAEFTKIIGVALADVSKIVGIAKDTVSKVCNLSKDSGGGGGSGIEQHGAFVVLQGAQNQSYLNQVVANPLVTGAGTGGPAIVTGKLDAK